MVEGVAHGVFDDLCRLGGRELVLGLALEFRFANENGKHRGRRAHHVFGRDLLRLLAAGQFAVGSEALIERLSQAVLVRAAFSCRDGVAIGREKPSSSAIQATAHSTDPWPPSFSTRPEKISFVTCVWPSIEPVR